MTASAVYTATTTKLVKDDIIKRLGIFYSEIKMKFKKIEFFWIFGIEDDVVYFQSSYNRQNLFYDVRDKRENTTGYSGVSDFVIFCDF